MNLSHLKEIIDKHILLHGRDDPQVVIQVKMPFTTIGGTPSVAVEKTLMGFDWDKGRFFLIPGEPLTYADRDFESKFKELQEKNGQLLYENKNLKRELNRFKKNKDN